MWEDCGAEVAEEEGEEGWDGEEVRCEGGVEESVEEVLALWEGRRGGSGVDVVVFAEGAAVRQAEEAVGVRRTQVLRCW